MALIQKAFSDIITFSRSSNATRVGPTGLVEYAPHNLILQSQTFDNASWTKGNSSVVANAAAAPDGTVTADKLVENTSSSTHQTYQATTLTAQVHTLSFYAKSAGRSWIFANWAASGNLGAYFNLGAGTVGTVDTGYSATIQSVGNGWYRCSVTKLTTAASWYAELDMATADGVFSYTGDGTSGIYLWGAQLSVGPYALDYTPTTSAAVYGPRFDFDPVTLAARGLLVEEQRVNSITYSEQFDNAAWTKYDCSASANAAVAPDGTSTADKLVENTANAAHAIANFSAMVFTAAPYTASFFIKAAGRNFAQVKLYNGAVNVGAWFNLSNGTLGSTSGSVTSSIVNFGNGWYRCSITATMTVAAGGPAVYACQVDGSDVYTGDGTSGIYLWGAQVEAGSFATSYIPTIASTVTRSADVASVNTLSPFYNAVEGTVFTEAANLNGQYPHLASFETDSSNAMWTYAQEASATTRLGNFDVVNGGATQAGINTVAGSSATVKLAGAYKANDFAVCLNGGAVVTDTSGTVPTVNKLQIGNRSATQYFSNGHIRRLAYYPRKLSSAELQALTA